MQFLPIERIEIENYEGSVYNLETEHEEYIVSGIVVHNCPHGWETHPDKLSPEQCAYLWMGE